MAIYRGRRVVVATPRRREVLTVARRALPLLMLPAAIAALERRTRRGRAAYRDARATTSAGEIPLLDWRGMEAPELQVRATHMGGQWIVTVAGELELWSAPDLELRVAPLVRQPGVVTLHLGQVSFLATGGLTVTPSGARCVINPGATDAGRYFVRVRKLAGANTANGYALWLNH